jgi:agmatinase
VDPSRSVQVGIRTDNPDTLGFNIIDAREMQRIGPEAVAGKICKILKDYPTYLTLKLQRF